MLCSADGHLIEPGNLWRERLPREFRDRAPAYDYDYEGNNRIWVFGDRKLSSEPLALEARENGDPITDDVPLRLKELDADGIWAETIFPNMGSFCLGYEDAALALAVARVYNDYVAEAFGPYRDREIPIAVIPVRDIPGAVQEIERVAALGLRGIALPITPPAPYFLDIYEPVFAAAQALHLPISFHVGTGTAGSERADATRAVAALGGGAALGDRAMNAIGTVGTASFATIPAEQLLGTLVGAGVFEQFPDLDVVVAECGAGWLASLMDAVDFAWVPKVGHNREARRPKSYNDAGELVDQGFKFKAGGWPHPLLPSEYIRRQVKVTFMDEPAPIKYREFTGVEPLMWGADFPHPEGTWPHSHEVLDQLLAGVSADDRAAITGGNLARLYNISVPETASV
jgi:predicted TIM-barrel fold metal-dependent hydrolase